MDAIRRHYREITIVCAFLLLFVNVGFTSTAFSVYQNYLVDLPGIGNVGGSLIVTVRTLVALLCMFVTGLAYRRINPRHVFAVATLCTCAGFLCYGSSRSLAGMCLAAFLSGIGYGFGGMVASTYLIGNWFSGKIGHISGFAATGSGVAAILVPICARWIIESASLSTAFYVEGAMALAISVMLFAFVRINPADVGYEKVRDPENLVHRLIHRKAAAKVRPTEDAAQVQSAESGAEREIGQMQPTAEDSARREAVQMQPAEEDAAEREIGQVKPATEDAAKQKAAHSCGKSESKDRPLGIDLPISGTIVMVLAMILLGGVSVAGYNYFGILLTTHDIDPTVAAMLISLAGVFLTISKFVVGTACDKLGTMAGSCIFFVLLIVGLTLCVLVGIGGVFEATLAAIMLGLGMPLGTTGIALWSLELTTPARMLLTIRRFQLSYAFGGFAFNMMPGVLCQITGTYATSYFILLFMAVACTMMFVFVYMRYAKPFVRPFFN